MLDGGGRKNDSGKPMLSLVSTPALFGLARVLTFGAQKYSADNWRDGFAWRRLINSLLRHGLEFSDGQDIDPESGLPTIDHLGCCWMFLSEAQKRRQGTDDRFKAEPSEREKKLAAFKKVFRERIERSGDGVSDEFQLFNKREIRELLELLDG
jgi:hypothetical protein